MPVSTQRASTRRSGCPAGASTPKPWRSSPSSAKPMTGASMPPISQQSPSLPPAGDAPSPAALAEAEVALSLCGAEVRALCPRWPHHGSGDAAQLLSRPQAAAARTEGRASSKIAAASEADAYLRGLHPKHPEFEKLRQKLLEMRTAAAATAMVKLPNGSAARSRQERSAGRLAAQAAEGRAAGGDRQAGRRELLRRHAEGCRDGLPDRERHAPRRHRRQRDARPAQRRQGAEPRQAARQHGRVALDARGSRRSLRHGQHPRIHAAHRQERRGHSHRARDHRTADQADAGVLRIYEDDRLPAALERAQLDQGAGAVAEPGARRHFVRPPGPAPVAQWPRHQPRERRLELFRYPQLRTSTSRRGQATCWAS